MKNTSELANYQVLQTPGIKASGWSRPRLEPKISGSLNASKSSVVGRFHMMDSSKNLVKLKQQF
jgi:hypothetical protein